MEALVMNAKQYTKLMKHLSKQREMKEKEKLLSSVQRVRDGRVVTVEDLDRVREFVNQNVYSHKKEVDLSHVERNLENDVLEDKNNVKKSKERLKRSGIDLERIKRFRRMQQHEQHLEKKL